MREIDSYSSAAQTVALCRFAGLSPRVFGQLLGIFGSLERILEASPEEFAQIDLLDQAAVVELGRIEERLEEAEQYCRLLEDREIQIVVHRDRDYPMLFEELNDPPPMLYVRGKLPAPERKVVALVGSNRATNLGIELTSKLAREFAASGVQVVSSLSGGIDCAAHLATHTADGESFGVADRGFDCLDNPAIAPVAVDLARNGGLISEYSPEQEFQESMVGESNRLVVGLAHGVVVTEVYGDSSRTLDLLQFCNDIGKLAFIMIDPSTGVLADEAGLEKALRCGALPLEGLDKLPDIVASLV